MDELDAQLDRPVRREPRVGVLGASRRLGVARGTVQARLDRLDGARGDHVVRPRRSSPEALGYPVTAFLHPGDPPAAAGTPRVVAHLAPIPEVLEVHTITGAGDLWCRVVARCQRRPQRVIDQVLDDTP